VTVLGSVCGEVKGQICPEGIEVVDHKLEVPLLNFVIVSLCVFFGVVKFLNWV
jgi:hypothetical protein